ncbi:galectin [Caerostris extrusa]|uniref:Galectin n=1 Tax=Caerostris extrusa TaxID=172846 RepID=A0AAV4XN66_CAEEX|nr:galectin [Caerostris extrusa]
MRGGGEETFYFGSFESRSVFRRWHWVRGASVFSTKPTETDLTSNLSHILSHSLSFSQLISFSCARDRKTVPHACSIPGGLCIGSKIYIHGMVPKDASQFSITLQRGADVEFADLHLHLLAKLGRSPVVVRNSRHGATWGVEEQLPGSFPFPEFPRSFLLIITAYMDSYEIEINGSSQFSLKVRDGLPISAITHLAIEAELSVRAIHIPVENMPRNLRLSVGSGLKMGDLFSIKGQPTEEAKNFTINWQSGPAKFDDVLFQLNPRLEEDRVVRNSRLDDEMGKEESTPEMPFKPNTPFDLVVGVRSLDFETRLDGKEWIPFGHRYDVGAAKTLFLEGDMQPSDICIDLAQLNPSGVLNGTNIKSRGIRLHQMCPVGPFSNSHSDTIDFSSDWGIRKRLLAFAFGQSERSPFKMQMTVQCGEGSEDSDVALRYLVQWEDDGSPKITLNSREEDNWGQEVKSRIDEGFYPGLAFDLLVARTDDGLRCFLNGTEHALFPYRLEDQKPDHVTVCGDVELQRLLLL